MKAHALLCFLALIWGPAAALVASPMRMGLSVGAQFPKDALKAWGVGGAPAVVYFYGADESPSCTKQCDAFNANLGQFDALKVKVVGVRNEKVRHIHN
jgi:hypothetical protein